jgi:hypothetical protein
VVIRLLGNSAVAIITVCWQAQPAVVPLGCGGCTASP